MGTRADFYVGRTEEAEWLGSIAWDGYPEGMPAYVAEAGSEEEFRAAVAGLLAEGDSNTTPEMGWPWPWENSGTTDFAYAFDGGDVWVSGYGSPWVTFSAYDPEGDETRGDPVTFPDMTKVSQPTLGPRSGLLVLGMPGAVEE